VLSAAFGLHLCDAGHLPGRSGFRGQRLGARGCRRRCSAHALSPRDPADLITHEGFSVVKSSADSLRISQGQVYLSQVLPILNVSIGYFGG
jgi:hypothetical protein